MCRLAQHKMAADVVETIYNDFGTAAQRNALLREFYGPQFALFEEKGGEEGRGLGEILALEEERGQRERILKYMRAKLLKMMDK